MYVRASLASATQTYLPDQGNLPGQKVRVQVLNVRPVQQELARVGGVESVYIYTYIVMKRVCVYNIRFDHCINMGRTARGSA